MSRRQLTYALGLLALAVWVSLASGWRSPSDRSSAGKPVQTVAVEKPSRSPSTRVGGHVTPYAGSAESDLPHGPAAALNSSDPRVRIHALETWAQHPGDKLDPATYALVDPDESVRARAEELWEHLLATQAATAPAASPPERQEKR